jgi:hypothetical protein
VILSLTGVLLPQYQDKVDSHSQPRHVRGDSVDAMAGPQSYVGQVLLSRSRWCDPRVSQASVDPQECESCDIPLDHRRHTFAQRGILNGL